MAAITKNDQHFMLLFSQNAKKKTEESLTLQLYINFLAKKYKYNIRTPTPTDTPTETPTETPTSTPTASLPVAETFGFSEAAVAQITENFGTVENFLRLRNQGQV